MKKLVLAAAAAATMMGTVASAATFNVYNHTQAAVILTWTNFAGASGITVNGGHSATGIEAERLQAEVFYAGYGRNEYGSIGDCNEYNINFWQQQPGYFAISVDKIKDNTCEAPRPY